MNRQAGQNPENNPAGESLERKALDLLAENPKEGLEMLARAYHKKAYHLALGILGNRDDALDVTQDAFIRVQRSISKYDRGRSFFPWFYTILSNLCRTRLSRRSKSSSRETAYEELTLVDVSAKNPHENLEAVEELKALRKALGGLLFADREIITLKHFEDYTYDQIAATLNIPRGTVMSRLYYARKRLADLMTKAGHGREVKES
ncbi:MAG: RNA polymerase sigma factor [candidate division Zixibacteria bacterium]|nr:RNA polymerase sigma factor [candidate division Zixibacteria bacterium]